MKKRLSSSPRVGSPWRLEQEECIVGAFNSKGAPMADVLELHGVVNRQA